jgi:hypothetical protein
VEGDEPLEPLALAPDRRCGPSGLAEDKESVRRI